MTSHNNPEQNIATEAQPTRANNILQGALKGFILNGLGGLLSKFASIFGTFGLPELFPKSQWIQKSARRIGVWLDVGIAAIANYESTQTSIDGFGGSLEQARQAEKERAEKAGEKYEGRLTRNPRIFLQTLAKAFSEDNGIIGSAGSESKKQESGVNKTPAP